MGKLERLCHSYLLYLIVDVHEGFLLAFCLERGCARPSPLARVVVLSSDGEVFYPVDGYAHFSGGGKS